jgi:hypothetical protein
MLAPFVRAGLVTVVPWDQASEATHLENDKKNGNSRICMEAYGGQADWVAVMDTDEYFYIKHKDQGMLGQLDGMLT